jgi:gliding motility-associated-like protein
LTFTQSGSQTTTLKNILNCDSVVTLNLTVLAASSIENKTVCATELPLNWNGLTFIQSGSQTTTLKNILNCDSVVTLNLTVLATTYSITEATVCQKDLPYIWNDRNYTESGVFNHTLVNIVGCDSIATLGLTVMQPSYTSALVTICQKDLPYIWNTKNLTESGIFKDTLINSFGCDSVVTLELSVIQTTYSTTKRVICPLQIPFIWNDIPCFGEGTYTKTLVNSNGCDSIATLDLRVESPLVSTTEVTICQSELPYRWNKITCNAAGTYHAAMKTSAGCDSVATLVLTVNRPTSAMKSTSVCEGESFRFNGMYYSPGSYLVNLENTNGCDSLVTLVVDQKKSSNVSQVVHLLPGESYTVNGKSYRSEGVYTEVIKSENSCDSVVVTEILFINVPNTITPNGDGLNDLFMEGWKVKIYNRNGILLHDGSNGWDGTYKGTPVSQDTYFYVLFFDSESGAKTKEGYLTVVR